MWSSGLGVAEQAPEIDKLVSFLQLKHRERDIDTIKSIFHLDKVRPLVLVKRDIMSENQIFQRFEKSHGQRTDETIQKYSYEKH